MALAIHGHVAAYLHKDFDLAFRRFETALRVNPSSAPAWLWSAAANAWIGNGPGAVEEINPAISLSPYDPLMYAYTTVAGMAHLADVQYERAAECGLRSIAQNTTYAATYQLLILALVLAGREVEAQPYIPQLLEAELGFTVERYRRRFPGSATPTGQLYCEALYQVPLIRTDVPSRAGRLT